MNISPAEFIAQKRDGRVHNAADLADWVAAYAKDELPDYQMAAWAMAVFFQGMAPEETAVLTRSMLDSGQTMQWDDSRPVVDKHSTGGIGDKVSIMLAPLLACCDLRVPMISGRGLGATGGTLDKLESIPGFTTQLPTSRIQEITEEVGCVIAGASEDIAPADKRLYGLRDVTATVPSIPLITGSIMSKKLAEGLDALVLDVKFGSGAFMKTIEQAEALAHSLVATGRAMGVATTALMTNMDEPLGRTIGNALEVDESVAFLRGEGPDDLNELTLELGAELLISSTDSTNQQRQSVKARLQEAIDSGAGMERLQQMVAAQGGDLDATRELANHVDDVLAPRGGFVSHIDSERIGYAIIDLGGGRRAKTDSVDFGVGIEMQTRVGDPVDAKQPLAKIYARNPSQLAQAKESVLSALTISDEPPTESPLVLKRIA